MNDLERLKIRLTALELDSKRKDDVIEDLRTRLENLTETVATVIHGRL